MLVRLFKSSQPSTLLLIPLVGVLLWLQHFLGNTTQAVFPFDSVQMPLYRWVNSFIPQNYWSSFLALICIILQAFWLVRLNSKYWLIQERTYLPAILYVVLTSSCPFLFRLHPILLGNFFFIWTLDLMFSSFKKKRAISNFFNASLTLALASMFYAPFVYFLPFILFGLVVLRPFRWREWLSVFIGFLTPYFLYVGFSFIINDHWNGFFDNLFNEGNNFANGIELTLPYYIYFAFILFLTLISAFYLLIIKYVKISTRRYFEVLFTIVIFTLALFFLLKTASYELLILFAIAFSFIFTNYIISLRSKLWGNALFLIFIGILIYIQLSI